MVKLNIIYSRRENFSNGCFFRVREYIDIFVSIFLQCGFAFFEMG